MADEFAVLIDTLREHRGRGIPFHLAWPKAVDAAVAQTKGHVSRNALVAALAATTAAWDRASRGRPPTPRERAVVRLSEAMGRDMDALELVEPDAPRPVQRGIERRERAREIRRDGHSWAQIAAVLGYPSENAARMAVVGDNGRLTDPSLARPPVETCKHGHALSGENVMVRSDGKRDCLACHRRRVREAQRRYRQRKKAAAGERMSA